MNELNREELFIGALGSRMLEETDEANTLDYVQEEVKNINNRVVRKIRTYTDGSVQIFQVVAKSQIDTITTVLYSLIRHVNLLLVNQSPVVKTKPLKRLLRLATATRWLT